MKRESPTIVVLAMTMLLFAINTFATEYAIFFPVNDSIRIGLTGMPYAAYSSEIGIELGLNVLLFERNASANVVPGQDFRMRLNIDYTVNDDRSISLTSSIPIRKHNQKVDFMLKYEKNQNDFYGIGTNTSSDIVTTYYREQYRFTGNWLKLLSLNHSAGLAWDISGFENSDFIHQNIRGFDHFYRAMGLGLVYVYNSKMPNNFPIEGTYYRNQIIFYDRAFISDFNFITLNQEFHYFFPLRSHVVANQIVSNNTFGNRPFHYYATQGSSTLMRGLKTNRFTERHFLGSQTEYRSPIFFWRVSGVCFVATGLSYGEVDDFAFRSVNVAGGFGFRFALDKEERVNLRADVGVSREGFEVYFKFGEAF